MHGLSVGVGVSGCEVAVVEEMIKDSEEIARAAASGLS